MISLESFIKYFFRHKDSASVAKERLQIIISHERATRNGLDYLPQLQNEILAVIAKYVKVDLDKVKVQLERVGDNAILELNVIMPERSTLEAEKPILQADG